VFLKNKFTLIVTNYKVELDTIGKIFEVDQQRPPMLRHVSPVLNRFLWASHLDSRICLPATFIKRQAELQDIPNEPKRFREAYSQLKHRVDAYLRAQLSEAWEPSVRGVLALMGSTLLVRDDLDKRLKVNLDPSLLQLIKECKVLQRRGAELPSSCCALLQREQQVKALADELSYAILCYEAISDKIKPIYRSILAGFVLSLETQFIPTFTTLTWESMGGRVYVQKLIQEIQRLDTLVTCFNDIIANRIEKRIRELAHLRLVVLESMPEYCRQVLKQHR
jgi:dynein heavy chain